MRDVRLALGSAVAVAIAAAIGPLDLGAQAPATLTVAQDAAVMALGSAGSPPVPANPAEDEAAYLVYDGLVRLTQNLTTVPALATAWRLASNGRTWMFTIRRGVSFQDGTPLTAPAVAQALQHAIDPKAQGFNRLLWDPIASVSAADAHTVQIMTKEPYGALLNALADRAGLIAGPIATEPSGGGHALPPAGTGPYAADRWDTGTTLEVVRNVRYWGQRPGFDRIVLRNVSDPNARVGMIQDRRAQVAEAIPAEHVDELRRVPGVTVAVQPTLRTVGMAINMNHPILQDLRVRQALNYAVDKELIVKALFGGNATVLRAPLAPQASGYAGDGPWPYDPPKARRLLDEAGWKPAPPIGVRIKGGQLLEITLLTPRSAFPRDVEVVETLADYLRNVGFEPHFLYVEPAALRDHLLVPPDQYTWDLAFFRFNPADGDGGYQLDALYRSNPDRQQRPRAWNVTWYANPRIDAWLAEGDRAIDPTIRAAAYARAERQIWNDVPYLWLYAEDAVVAMRKVAGVEVLPTGVTLLRSARP